MKTVPPSVTTTPGKIFVFEGGDGAGKATQTRLLVEALCASGNTVETLDFPQYTQTVFGKLLRECLDGKRGDFISYDARVASLLYSLDRFVAKDKINAWLREGKIVVLDRYISANMLHQGAKIADIAEFDNYLAWIEDVEHNVLGIPKPDKVYLLNNPLAHRRKLVAQSAEEGVKRRSSDTAENNMAHQTAVDNSIKHLLARNHTWKEVVCTTQEGTLRTPEDIHKEIFEDVRNALNA